MDLEKIKKATSKIIGHRVSTVKKDDNLYHFLIFVNPTKLWESGKKLNDIYKTLQQMSTSLSVDYWDISIKIEKTPEFMDSVDEVKQSISNHINEIDPEFDFEIKLHSTYIENNKIGLYFDVISSQSLFRRFKHKRDFMKRLNNDINPHPEKFTLELDFTIK